MKLTVGARVLAITPDRNSLRHIRLEVPLRSLKRQGLIGDYFITDDFLTDLPGDLRFDAVWLQRVERLDLIKSLAHNFDNKYLYDVDDLLIGKPTYTKAVFGASDGSRLAIENCSLLSTTSERLLRLLEEYSKLNLVEKSIICPNGFEPPASIRTPSAPRGLIWTSSDYPALMHSKAPILRAISRFSRKNDLPIYLFGFFDKGTKAKLKRSVEYGLVPFETYRSMLTSLPVLIAIAPLETRAKKHDIDFINAKSDIKMIDFGGSGHPAVYSAAPPYVDTDLKAGILAENDENSWFEGFELIYRKGWKRLDTEQSDIIRRRHMDVIARECWLDAISKVRFPRPMFGKDVKSLCQSRVSIATKISALYESSSFLQTVVERMPRPLLRVMRNILLRR